MLNLGHTFAHAIETASGTHPAGRPELAPLLHGEAVGLGLIAATALAAALERRTAGDIDEIRSVVESVGLPVRCSGLRDDERIVDAMRQDKKSLGGAWRFVIPVGTGRCEVVENPPRADVLAGLDAIRDEP